MTNKDQRSYHAYLLRIWRDPSTSSECDADGAWRIELQSAETREKVALNQLDELPAFLRNRATVEREKGTQNE